MAILDRVLYEAVARFPMLSPLSVEPKGLGCEALMREAPGFDRSRLAPALEFVLAEFMTVLGKLVAEILSPALHAELDRIMIQQASERPPKRGSVEDREVRADRYWGRGTEFTVRLPAIGAPHAAPISASSVRRVLVQPLRILVADESADTANSMALLLERAGHKVSVADSGHSALHAARTFRPEVAFLDVDLPKLDGYEVARKMRSDFSLRDMVLVAMSAHGSESERMRADEAGFRHFLVKPAEFGHIREILLETAAQLGRCLQSLH